MFKAIHAIVSVDELEGRMEPIASGIGRALSGIILTYEDRILEISGNIQYVQEHTNLNQVPTLFGKIPRNTWLSEAYTEISLWESRLNELYAAIQ